MQTFQRNPQPVCAIMRSSNLTRLQKDLHAIECLDMDIQRGVMSIPVAIGDLHQVPAILCVYVLTGHGSPQVCTASGDPEHNERNDK